MVRVKICSITNLEDAEAAVSFGADALGFIFAKSPRRISPQKAKRITRSLGPWVTAVGVFVDEDVNVIRRIASECALHGVQLHGSESVSKIRGLSSYSVIKTFHVSESLDWKKTKNSPADAFLFDTCAPGRWGGTGIRFDWNLLKSRSFDKPFIVSGGLNPGNVGRVIHELSPYGVDVSSGVERSPGKKDRKLLREFLQNAKKD